MKRTVATTLVLALPLSALLWLSGAVPLHLALGGVTLVVFFVTFSGFLALRALRLAELPASAAWVAGAFASALVVYALVAWFKLLAVHAFALWAGALAACAVIFPERDPRAQPLDREDLASLAVCGLVTLMWCRAIAQAPTGLVREGVLYAWIDYFVHGGIISQFGDPLATRGSVFLADHAPLLYHYASYMLPAVLAGLLDQPGLALATSFWLPMGVLTMCAGASGARSSPPARRGSASRCSPPDFRPGSPPRRSPRLPCARASFFFSAPRCSPSCSLSSRSTRRPTRISRCRSSSTCCTTGRSRPPIPASTGCSSMSMARSSRLSRAFCSCISRASARSLSCIRSRYGWRTVRERFGPSMASPLSCLPRISR